MGLFDRLRGEDGPRVAFLGIDGVPWSLVEDNPERFPNLTALAEAGAGGPIDSIVPPESSACWPALTTGMNPGETGVYGFQDREVGSYDTYVPMGRDVQATRVWDRVQDADRQATVMNVPVTFPPQRNVQRMVSGFLSPGVEKAATPDDMRSHLDRTGYRIDVNAKLGHKVDKTEFVVDAHETLEARYGSEDPADWLLANRHSEFGPLGGTNSELIPITNRASYQQSIAIGEGEGSEAHRGKSVLPPSNLGHVDTWELISSQFGDDPDRLTTQLEMYSNHGFKPQPISRTAVEERAVQTNQYD